MTDFYEDLAARLTDLRKSQGLSQQQFADRLGLTQTSVSRNEGGTRRPGPAELLKVSQEFAVSLDALYGLTPTVDVGDEARLREALASIHEILVKTARSLSF